jgi:NADH-quinone oxidoreductase subunit J
MVLAHRERTSPKPTQKSLSRQRIASGQPTPLPGPGTYARHNAVDMPALLPDGTTSDLSVSEVITGARSELELEGRAIVASDEDQEPDPDPDQVKVGGPADHGQREGGEA